MESNPLRLPLLPLTREAFAPYGDVIDETGPTVFETNGGDAIRIHALAGIDCSAEDGRPIISLFRVKGPTRRKRLYLMERHPISTQAFIPLSPVRAVVVVAPAGEAPSPDNIRAFVTDGSQGFSYGRNTWHHPLITLSAGTFLVIDRAGPGPGFSQDYADMNIETMNIELAANL